MEDEVQKYTRKVFKTFKDPHQTFIEKAKEIFVEIMIIVLAVTISIWFHNWDLHRHEQKNVKDFLKGLKEDMSKQLTFLEEDKAITKMLDSNYQYLLKLDKSKLSSHDTALEKELDRHMRFTIPLTQPNDGSYQGFKSSGKIETIEDDSLKKDILVFYQQTMPDLNYAQNYVNSLELKLIDFYFQKNEQELMTHFLTTRQMQSYLSLAHHNFGVCIDNYDEAIAGANKIIAAIDKEGK